MIIRFKEYDQWAKRYVEVAIKVKPFEVNAYIKDIGIENILSVTEIKK